MVMGGSERSNTGTGMQREKGKKAGGWEIRTKNEEDIDKDNNKKIQERTKENSVGEGRVTLVGKPRRKKCT